MKRNLLLLLLSICLFACKKEEPVDLHSYTNRWILKEMNTNYYWNDKIPSHVNIALEHGEFFKSLLYRYKQPDGDRFSWIQPNYLELMKMLRGVTPMDLGFYYRPFKTEKKGKLIFLVLYIKEGSDAAAKGLKRGDIILAVNGEEITMDNYQAVFENKNNLNLNVLNKEELQINSMQNFPENPILLSKTLRPEGSDKKIAYLAYMFFSPDKGDNSNSYDKALVNEFEKFAADGVDEFVLDLRYNGGGSVSSCQVLSSLLKKNRKEDEVFARLQTNKSLDENKAYNFIETHLDKTLPSLEKISQLYVITGKGTASASEMVINALRPHMDVILVGDTTVGKNVGSITIYEKNSANKWGIQPITFKIFNGQGESDYSAGFVPTHAINEFLLPIVELGDPTEPLLNKSLELMGITVARTSRLKREISPSSPVLGEPLHKRVTRENWQGSEMEYPMYIENDF